MNKRISSVAKISLSVFGILAISVWSRRAHAQPVKKELEAVAGDSPFFEITDVIYRGDAVATIRYVSEKKEYAAFMAHFLSIHADRDELIAQLKHPDPKVRTLAIAALAMRNDPTVLPYIADLLSDNAITFTRNGPLAQRADINPGLRIDVTVGEEAQEVLFLYLSPAGYTGYQFLGSRSGQQKNRREFDEYWSTHKDRAWCASWFAVRLNRGSFSSPERFAIIKRDVRADIEKIPQPDRTWIALWLDNEREYDHLYSKDELLVMCKQLGPEALMSALKEQRFPVDDPDLQHGTGNNPKFGNVARFILQNATTLLRPDDAATLADMNAHGNGGLWSYIAIAELQPAKAVEILQSAYARFPGDYAYYERTTLGIALWKMGGESQIPFLTGKFYDEALTPHSLHYGWGHDFIDGIVSTGKAPCRKLIAAILQDKKLDDLKLDRMTFASIARAVNGWAEKPIVTDEEIAAAGSGEGGKGGNPEPANLALKTELIHRLRDSVPQWNL